MQTDPAELQILKQLLGPELGAMTFALNTLAASVAQLGQQVREQADKLDQLAAAAPDEAAPPADSANPWTGPTEPEAT